MKEFKGKVAVVTGAASGIGLGLAKHCAKEGMKVVLADIEEPALNEAEKALKASGADVLAVKMDVSRLEDVQALAQQTLDAYGGVHLLFNNAGVNVAASLSRPVWQNALVDWEWVLGVNLWGVIYGVKVFLPIMLAQDTDSHVVNVSSMAGLIAEPQLVIYAVTKAGLVSLSEGLYIQLKKQQARVGVSMLCPGFVTSRLGDAERNRPPRLRDTTGAPTKPERPELVKLFSQVKVLTPEQCADIVFKAIREDRFYIFTHQLVAEIFKQRSDNILKGKNPEMPRIS